MSCSEQFREFSSKSQNFESFEVSELFSSGLSGERFSQRAIIKCFLDILLSNYFSQFSCSDASTDFKNLLSKLESSDWDDLSSKSFSINKNSLVIDNINDGGKFSFERTVVNSCNSTDLNKSVVTLNKMMLTILW